MKIQIIKSIMNEINFDISEKEIENILEENNLTGIKNSKLVSIIFRHGMLFSFNESIIFVQKTYNTLNKNYKVPENGIIDFETIEKINNYKFYKNFYKTLMIFQGNRLINLMDSEQVINFDFFNGEIDIKDYFRIWVDKF